MYISKQIKNHLVIFKIFLILWLNIKYTYLSYRKKHLPLSFFKKFWNDIHLFTRLNCNLRWPIKTRKSFSWNKIKEKMSRDSFYIKRIGKQISDIRMIMYLFYLACFPLTVFPSTSIIYLTSGLSRNAPDGKRRIVKDREQQLLSA